ncbi:hypothetical protein [Bdellovibrio sp. NC01]|uniref:hypothetical protein n=1 Tax=Bdellovibrio sp. NC01 TaxID=2220073 RepID=UPI00115C3AB9|nr:hypothetical protein [Bdellovibrio sp. NC01]QDK37617.1 hypothetical protein DOE51_08485 [Bdellovibrio sp. NC01]
MKYVAVFFLVLICSNVNAQVLAQKDVHFSANFGKVKIGESARVHWNLRAKDFDLAIQSIDVSGLAFKLETDCPVTLPAQQRCAVGAVFTPSTEGVQQGQLVVDLYTEKFVIDLAGEGIN